MVEPRPSPPPGSALGVEIIRWPADADRREELRRAGVPRLLVLEVGQVPPSPLDDREDWIWLPAGEQDVLARLRVLATNATDAPAGTGTVAVGDDGRAWIAGRPLDLPPAEAAILRCLADPPGRLRTRQELGRAAWGDVPHEHRSLDSRVFVLRRRLAPHGLLIRAVRGRGFVLIGADPGPPP